MPNLFGVGFPAPRETPEWLGRAYALLEESNSSDALSMKLACKMLLSQHARESEDAANEILAKMKEATHRSPPPSPSTRWAQFLAAVKVSAEGLLMTPRRTGTDGFFVSVMRRR
jgi:hypothetical protein